MFYSIIIVLYSVLLLLYYNLFIYQFVGMKTLIFTQTLIK